MRDAGHGLERWADAGALAALERAYAHYDLRDAARALWETIDLFQGLEEETARRLGLDRSISIMRSCGAARGRRPRPAAWIYPLAVKRALLLAVAARACSSPDAATTRRARRPRPLRTRRASRVYFLRDGKVWPVRVERSRPRTARTTARTGRACEGPDGAGEAGPRASRPRSPERPGRDATRLLRSLSSSTRSRSSPTSELGRDRRGCATHAPTSRSRRR